MASKSTPDLLAAEKNKPQGYPFEWGGTTWTLRPQFDVRAVPALKRGDIDLVLRLLLGREQADQMLEVDTDDVFDIGVLAAMIEEAAKHQGMSVGESPASQS